jgi:hypothetical protein
MMNARKLLIAPLAVLCALVGMLVLASVPAFAAAPEAPSAVVVESVKATEATVRGTLNPGKSGAPGTYETGTYEFLYKQSSTECEGGSASAPGMSLGAGKEEVPEQTLSGLQPSVQYTVCLLARNAAEETALGAPVTFSTAPMASAISEESFSEVSQTGATLTAQINTENQESRYHFKYGTSAEFSAGTTKTTKEEVLAPNGVSAPASARLYGLQPATEYRFQLVVTNHGNETSEGTQEAFTTLPAESGAVVPDKRIDEMVTPPENLDAEVYAPRSYETQEFGSGYYSQFSFRVAADGNRVVYEAEPTHNGGGESAANGAGSAYLAARSPEGAWSQISIQPPGRRKTHYYGFSSNLSVGIMGSYSESAQNEEGQLPGPPAPPAPASGRFGYSDLYLTTLGGEAYDPLITTTPPNRSVGEFDEAFVADAGDHYITPTYVGASADMSQLLFMADDDVLPGEGSLEKELDQDAKNEIAHEEYNNYLYDWTPQGVHLVDLLPEDKGVAPNAIFGATQEGDWGQDPDPPNFDKVISTDGSRIFWSTLEPPAGSGTYKFYSAREPKALYVRENAAQPQSPLNGQGECTDSGDACTVQIDKAVGGGGRYWDASSDGSKVFFTKGDLYEYNLNTGVTSDLTSGVAVQGVLGASEAGDYVYYVDTVGKLYVLHESGGQWQAPIAIATLPGEATQTPPYTAETGGMHFGGDWTADIGFRTSEVTPNGLGLVFVSGQRLDVQGFPNGAPVIPGVVEVYVYEAADNRLFCASCSQSGETSGEGWLPVSYSDSYRPTWISEDGDEVFFDSVSGLLPQDTNGNIDVYEWEREGTGSCASGTGLRGGCIYLLSGGNNRWASWLIGASASGSNLFMVTRDQLTTADQNENYDVYDARAEGVQPLNLPECTGTGCQGIPGAPPVFATPSSVTFAGVGNFESTAPTKAAVKARTRPLTRARKFGAALRACKKLKRKAKRESCETRARKRYGSKKTKSSAKGRK